MSHDKILELIKKIKALADQGVGGEKQNAQERLEFLLKKHHISLSDIEGEAKKQFHFRLRKEQFKFFNQICYNVCGDEYRLFYTKRYRTGAYDKYKLECTDAQYIEIQMKFDFYWPRYQEDLEIFYSAFIQRNALYGVSTRNENPDADPPELSDKEWKVLQMASGLDAHQFYKQIGNKKS